MPLTLEDYMKAEKLPEKARRLLRKQADHSVSCYGLNGEHLPNDFDKEDLLTIMMRMERFLLDTNSLEVLRDAKRPENQNKAFILGQTVEEEVENLEALLFGRNVDNSNNNIFDFGFVGPEKSGLHHPYLILNRLDLHYRLTFDDKRLKRESRTRKERTEREFFEREREHMANVLDLKQAILGQILRWPDIANLPPVEFTERKKSQLVRIIRVMAGDAHKNYDTAVHVASLCYATLLLEQDDVGKKTRAEFSDPLRRNVFGDTRLIAEALWLNAHVLSKDIAVKRMAQYVASKTVTVTETV